MRENPRGSPGEEIAPDSWRRVAIFGSLLFFASGFTGLAYEVIWFKHFSHVWGSSTLATAAVVGSFLLGLGVGAHFLGGFADRVPRPLYWYGVFEIAVGILALLIPFEVKLLRSASGALYSALAGAPLAYYFARLALTFLVIGPPTILMGGTLPLMVRQFTRVATGLRGSTGWFYAINTIGAATGCYVSGFHLLGRFGLSGTNGITAAMNVTIGVAALLLARTIATEPIDTKEEAAAESVTALRATSLATRSPALLYGVAALTGFAALVLQIVWVRQLSLLLGGTTYAFTAVLFVVLVGIAAGSFAFRVFSGRNITLEYLPAIAIPLLVVTTAIGQMVLEPLTFYVAGLNAKRASEAFNALTCVAASSVLQLVPAVVMGLLFPFLVHLTRRGVEQAGLAVGRIYAFNTVGSILGASLTSVLIVPWIGTTGSAELAIGAYGLSLILLFPLAGNWQKVAAVAVPAVIVAVAVLAISPPDPRATNAGGYLYGADMARSILERDRILMFEEGPMTSVLVTDLEGKVYLRVDGKVDATSEGDMGTQLGLAYFPHFLRPEAKEVCVIGYGSGSTAGASCLFPGTRVACCEIEPMVYAASRFFSQVNHDPPSQPNFEIVLDDGRNYLQATDRQFDLIISEPSNPWMPGIANLFTEEFYEGAKAKLKPGGMLTQWVQIYDFSLSEYALIARTLESVFPYVALIRIHALDTLLIASTEPIVVSRDVMDRAQALVNSLPAVQADLAKTYGTTDVRSLFLRHWFLDQAGLDRLIAADGGTGLNTDGNMRLAFDAPLRIFRNRNVTGQPEMNRHILEASRSSWFEEMFREQGAGPTQVDTLMQVSKIYRDIGRPADSQRLVDAAFPVAPNDQRMLAEGIVLALIASPAGASEQTWNRLDGLPFEAATWAGVQLWERKAYESAVAVFQRLTKKVPASGPTWINLAVNLQALGRWDDADSAFREAVQIEPARRDFQALYQEFQAARRSAGGGR